MTEAPRWRLTAAHYLNVQVLLDGTKVEWEHKETSRESGRAVRKLFSVPMFLEPKDAADHNYTGEIIVAHATQDMEPLNEAAETITESCRPRWIHPIDTMPMNGGMTQAESVFMQKMMEAFERIAAPRAEPKADEVTELRERLARLEALLAAPGKPSADPAAGLRRN